MHRSAACSPQGVNRDMEIREFCGGNAEQGTSRPSVERYAGNCTRRLGSRHKVTALGSMHHTVRPDRRGGLRQVLPIRERFVVQRKDQLRGCGWEHVLAIKLPNVALGPPQPLDVAVERCGRPIPNYRHEGILSTHRSSFQIALAGQFGSTNFEQNADTHNPY